MNTSPLYFLHIHKTGGTSLSSVLRRAYPMYRSLVSSQYEDVSYVDSFHAYDYVDGHLAWLPDHLLQPGTLRCTVLRDPIARTISHMFYDQNSLNTNVLANIARLKPLITDEEEEALRKGNFLRVLQSETLRTRYENRQCKSLSRTFFGTSIRDDNPVISWAPPANESDFIAAQQHLQAINFVGLTERLDDTARMIGAAIGLSVEKAPRKISIPARTAHRLLPSLYSTFYSTRHSSEKFFRSSKTSTAMTSSCTAWRRNASRRSGKRMRTCRPCE